MSYRNLTGNEIKLLERQGCDSDDWNEITVKEGFSTKFIRNSSFSGTVQFGIISVPKETDRANFKPGIYNSLISNCEIGDNVRIYNAGHIEGYEIEDGAVIENVKSIRFTGDSNFGIGERISVLNEAGGRELPLLPDLSSQIAYLIVNYRDDPDLQRNIEKLCKKEIKRLNFSTGKIGKNSKISNVNEISNVIIGEQSIIENTAFLKNGTIISDQDDPVFIGANVICRNFVMLQGSKITDSAVLENCFVGQSVKIGKQYSAENSAFFANGEFYHGEACSIFAGPYTVSHHKSSLLIAGYFSFYNAGSGTNQSNHMYKLGPVHQGHLERGSKTGSFSYLLFPTKVGAFSVVIGKHFNNFDSSEFPFSYITEEEGKSSLTPALNLFSVGTKRDSDKWKKRDKRKSRVKLDKINFDLFSPFITSKMISASGILGKLYSETPKEKKSVLYKGLKLPRLLMKSCRKYYELGISIAVGEHLVKKIESMKYDNIEEILKSLQDFNKSEKDDWIDAGGQFLPKSELKKIINKVNSNVFNSISELNEEFDKLHNDYDNISWNWYKGLISEIYNDKLNDPNELMKIIIDKWYTSKTKVLNMILKDAEKEFENNSRISYGIAGDEQSRDLDFSNVRGSFDNNAFVKEVNSEIKDCETIYQKVNSLLNK